MKIAQLTPYFPPHLGGVEIHVKELSEELEKRGHRIKVYTTDVGMEEKETNDSTEFGFEIKRFKALSLPYMPFVPQLSKKLNHLPEEFDVIHSHLPPPFFTSSTPDKNHVTTYHCDIDIPPKIAGKPVPESFRKTGEIFYEKLYSGLLNECNQIIATTKSYGETSNLLQETNFKVVPNAIHPEKFKFSVKKEPTMLFVGRITSTKGIYDLLNAAPKILENTWLEKIKIIGEGGEKKSVEEKIEKKGLKKVNLLGKIGFEKLVDEYSSATCLVLPSKSRLEAFGIVQLEAMASGTPVISSNIPGVKDVGIEGETKISFEPGDPQDLLRATQKLLSKDLNKMGKKSRKIVEEKYCWKKVASTLEDIYKDTLKNN